MWGATASVSLGRRLDSTALGGRVAELAGRSVLIATRDQFATALALIELDGIARRLIVCTPDLPTAHLPEVVAQAGVDAIVSDHDRGDDGAGVPLRVLCNGTVTPAAEFRIQNSEFGIPTEWVLLTSGTTGAPKMLVHSFASLTAPINNAREGREDVRTASQVDRQSGGGQSRPIR